MHTALSLLELRINHKPQLPNQFRDFKLLIPKILEGTPFKFNDPELSRLFSETSHFPLIQFTKDSNPFHKPLKVGVVLSGGPAAGGHNVIAGLYDALKKLNQESILYGFLNGPKGIIENKFVEIRSRSLENYRNTGGFDLIGSGRTKIETEEQFASSENTVRSLNLDGLVIAGGDDSNTNAALLAEYFLKKNLRTKVIGVPKTIDGDLKNEYIEASFGFDSACKTYSELIGNLMRDSLSQKKYYFFIKIMGRSASHIALECALQTHPNLTFIGEEIEQKGYTLQDISRQIADFICLRASQGKDYGVILIPEGVIEFIPECKQLIADLNQSKELTGASKDCFNLMPTEVQNQLKLDRDPHGNVQVSKIESERLFIELVKKELAERKKNGSYQGQFSPQPVFYGYEGRCCFPSNFDANYCYALGHAATLLINYGYTGYMATIKHLYQPVEEWSVLGVPLARMIHLESRKGKLKPVIKKALVDLEGAPYRLFESHRKSWMEQDDFHFPGPIQFFGPQALNSSITVTLAEESQRHLAGQI